MESGRSDIDPATIPCPACGDTALRSFSFHNYGIDIGDPMLATPVARLCAVAVEMNILVQDLAADKTDGYAGGLALGYNDRGDVRGMICLSEDLDDDLRADALGFSIATLVTDSARIAKTPDAYIGLSMERLPAARIGPGHLAWHMVRCCGRITTSATFELVDIP